MEMRFASFDSAFRESERWSESTVGRDVLAGEGEEERFSRVWVIFHFLFPSTAETTVFTLSFCCFLIFIWLTPYMLPKPWAKQCFS